MVSDERAREPLQPRGARSRGRAGCRSTSQSLDSHAANEAAAFCASRPTRPEALQPGTNTGDSSVGRASDCRVVQTSDGPLFDSGSPDFFLLNLAAAAVVALAHACSTAVCPRLNMNNQVDHTATNQFNNKTENCLSKTAPAPPQARAWRASPARSRGP